MNKNGFTLIELIATIAIMGIISMMAYPSLNRIMTQNKNKKFEQYTESLRSGAKLYVESYKNDLWSIEEIGTRKINYSDLKEHQMIKDYNLDNIGCNGSFINVTKQKNGENNYNYSYKVVTQCTKNGNTVYTNIE